MRKRIGVFGVAAVLSLALMGGSAQAEEGEGLLHPWGMSVSAGGGVSDFAGDSLVNMTGVGGSWDTRFMFGTRKYVAFEAAYVGTAQSIEALGMDDSALLVSNGVEGDVRFNAALGAWQPYAFVGAGWKRFDVTNTDTNTSDVSDQDNVFEVPLGFGVSWRRAGLLIDARASYRIATDEDLVAATGSQEAADLDSINVAAHAGWEF